MLYLVVVTHMMLKRDSVSYKRYKFNRNLSALVCDGTNNNTPKEIKLSEGWKRI